MCMNRMRKLVVVPGNTCVTTLECSLLIVCMYSSFLALDIFVARGTARHVLCVSMCHILAISGRNTKLTATSRDFASFLLVF